MEEPLGFEERNTLFSSYLGKKDHLYQQYQMLSNANLSEKQRLDQREETKLEVYGITNEALELAVHTFILENFYKKSNISKLK